MALKTIVEPGLLQFCTTERQTEVLEAVLYHGSQSKAAKALGLYRRTVDQAVARVHANAVRRGYAPEFNQTKPAPEGQYVHGVSTYYDEDGNVKGQWVKTRREEQDVLVAIQGFVDGLLDEVKGRARPTKPPKANVDDMMACYVIGDAHLGAYAWAEETLAQDFDTDIATRDLGMAFDYLVSTVPATKVGTFVNVGDFLHANDTTSMTPASKHLLDTDGRFAQVIRKAAHLVKYCIDRMLQKHEIVQVINARGNHDPDAALWLNQVIEAYYHNEPRVQVLPNASKFIYFQFGDCLVCVHHGDRVKRQQLYEAMTRDCRGMWGATTRAYCWTGHIHHKQAEEIGGCLFESFNTLAPRDGWHAASGYGANQEMQAIILDKKAGIRTRHIFNLDLPEVAA